MGKVTPLKRSATVLHAKLGVEIDLPSRILRVSSDPNSLPDLDHAFLSQDDSKLPDGYATYFTRQKDSTPAASFATPKALHYSLPSSLNHLDHGDIVRINPGKGELWVMYRKNSPSNAMLVTERCNSWCVMCSQPPKAADDTALAREWLQAIPLMDPDSRDLGITVSAHHDRG